MNRADEAPNEPSAPSLRQPQELQFRTLQISGARRGFRLEAIYWDALEVLSRRNGRSLASEVGVRLGSAPDDANQSAALRTSVTSELMALWQSEASLAAKPQGASLVAALPVPAFTASHRGLLLAANEPLLTFLQQRRGGREPPLNTLQGGLGLGVEIPPSAVAEIATDAERQFVSCVVTFTAGRYRVGCRTRLISIKGSSVAVPVLLGVLEEGRS